MDSLREPLELVTQCVTSRERPGECKPLLQTNELCFDGFTGLAPGMKALSLLLTLSDVVLHLLHCAKQFLIRREEAQDEMLTVEKLNHLFTLFVEVLHHLLLGLAEGFFALNLLIGVPSLQGET